MRSFILSFLLLLSGCGQTPGFAYSLDQWATAIGRAENSTTHPYGIMIKYRHTSPEMACEHTVWHRWLLYKKSGVKTPFIAYLQASYAPLGAKNDPKGLNRNWQRNVLFYLEKSQ